MANGSLTGMKIPKPAAKFIRARQEYLQLKNGKDGAARKKKLKEIMESEFMKAFRLAPDIRKKAQKLSRELFPNGGGSDNGLDHCTYYYSLDNAVATVVTQPYGDCTKQLTNTLALGAWSIPEVLDASDWGFYSPGKARLHIIFFPHGYAEALVSLKRSLRV
jgi:hypothetical protein